MWRLRVLASHKYKPVDDLGKSLASTLGSRFVPDDMIMISGLQVHVFVVEIHF